MEIDNKTPVTLTQSAVTEIKRLMSKENFDQQKFLRVGVKGGGCSGMSYVLDFDTRTEKDEYFEIAGIPCIMNPAHGIFLRDMEVDFGTGLDARGFTFNNPNASTTCGCGSSFGV
ncbi:MAG TPA: iron-sulfur cluster assembly accessory protein [Chitinophagaceae bacterium]|nr:iron-sulfur cluster assembly accessory protein [Chitinophagaceae bacterium]